MTRLCFKILQEKRELVIDKTIERSVWLAQSVEHATLDLRGRSSSPTLNTLKGHSFS